MAEIAVDEIRLLKTMRWWDGFVIGLANPGFILVGLAGSVLTLGPLLAALVWFASAVVGAAQAYIYSEPAAMFPDKPGGLSMYAKEGWRSRFSLAGPIATFGYWFAWSSVLAIYGGIIGTLFMTRFTDTDPFEKQFGLLFVDVTWARIIGALAILSCFLFNIRGMRPAVWFSYVTGAMMVIPVAALAIIPLLNGDITSHALNVDNTAASLEFYEGPSGSFGTFVIIAVWFWVIAWSSYGPEAPASFAPEFVDTKNDTRMALISTGILNFILALLLPLTVVGILGLEFIAGDLTFIAFLTEALDQTVGNFLGGLFVLFICGGLLLSMNTATMDGSRALYGMAREGLTIKWLDNLNNHAVPARAMTLDMVLNLGLLFMAPSLLFTLVAGNIGYVLSHVLALSGFLLLRKDRPAWPRPIKHGPFWIAVAWLCLAVNLIGTVFGVIYIRLTGYLGKTDAAGNFDIRGWQDAAIATGLIALVVGIVGWAIGQRQHGRALSLRDPSDEKPADEAYTLAGLPVPASGD